MSAQCLGCCWVFLDFSGSCWRWRGTRLLVIGNKVISLSKQGRAVGSPPTAELVGAAPLELASSAPSVNYIFQQSPAHTFHFQIAAFP